MAVAAVAMVAALVNSSYGRALQAIREDETAAKAMGVNTFRHLLGAYLLSAFCFGVGGGLLAHLITTISPSLFTFFLTFNLLIIIVVGGLGSTTGADPGRGLLHPGGGVAEGGGGAGHHLGSHHPGHSRDAHGDSLPGAAAGDHFLPPGPAGPPGIFLGRAGPLARTGGAPTPRPAPGNHKVAMALLRTENLDMRFGGLSALEDLNLAVPAGGLYGLIGPNGAGKTTVFNLISGFLKPTGGRIFWDGATSPGNLPHRLTALGIARTFQNIRLFGELSVLDNVLVGFHCRSRATWSEAVLRLPRYRREEQGPPGPGPERSLGGGLGGRRRTSPPASSPTATSAAWRSPGPWPRGPASSCWMSPRPASTPQETLDLIDFHQSRSRGAIT